MKKKKSIITDLVRTLEKDDELFYSYQANIVMLCYDAINRIEGYKSLYKIKQACNKGGVEFLNALCGSKKGKRRKIRDNNPFEYKRF